MAKKIISAGLSIFYLVLLYILSYLISYLSNVNFNEILTSVLSGGALTMSYNHFMTNIGEDN